MTAPMEVENDDGLEPSKPILLPIQSSREHDTPEWAMIELNGEILPPKENSSDREMVEMGSLKFQNEVGTPQVEYCDRKWLLYHT